jgi:5'-nucleotidase
MTELYTIIQHKHYQSNNIFRHYSITTFILILINFILLINTITFAILWKKQTSTLSSSNKHALNNGMIGFPPLLPNDGKYLQWTILQLNDVYEMLPLDQQRKGGLARVASVRQLLLQENPQTFTILAGDFLSPSALSHSKVNGTTLNGKQMIASFNTLGVDFVTFGNHEFDLTQSDLISRMNESTFKWISSNVFQSGTNQSFSISIPYHILNIDQIRILFIGLTIDKNQSYVQIVNKTSLIPFVKQFLQSLSNIKYDVLIALTHLDLSTDIELADNIPQIDLILGGHEHEDYYLLRGSKWTPITKADANAFTVYIHRCAFNLNTKQFRVYSTLSKITSELSDEPKTNDVVNYWFNLGIKGFEEMGYEPHKSVSCLPSNIELDGRSSSVRNFETLLSKSGCDCLIKTIEEDSIIIGIYNTGSIRIDDILHGNVSEYDILRILPFENQIKLLSVPGEIVCDVLLNGLLLKGSGMYLSYCGIETFDEGKTWLINDTNICKSDLKYKVITTDYMKENSYLNNVEVIVLKEYKISHTKRLIDYLSKKYPPC